MEKERAESNTAREKVGAHYKKYQEEQLDEFESAKNTDSDEGSDQDKGEKEWFEELKQDPYVGEAIKIFGDLSS